MGSYKKAADELSVTPAAVKQLVAKLEDAFGEPLMRFEGREMVLTRIGAQAHYDLSSAFRQISFAVERIRNACEDDRLIVSVEPSIASAWLVPRLQHFRDQHPDIEILVDSSLAIVDLSDDAVSVAVRFGVQDHGEHIAHRLFDEHLSALCSPGLAAGPPPMTEIADLQNVALLRWDLSAYPWAVETTKWNFWHTWLEAVGANDVKPGGGINYTDYNQAVQAAVSGQGFILGSKPILQNYISSGLLVDPFDVSAHPGIGYDVVTTTQALDRSKVQKFVNWILREAQL
ncbi:LysR substrate-binding domain-containing protein [Roseovarius phycicola]|uniref:LysR substrate-binding domain-containing protein n=1 Tax=Roseovarius phycicola TaxID=3080976 RepID=A0ABZ2HK12_9RHOB